MPRHCRGLLIVGDKTAAPTLEMCARLQARHGERVRSIKQSLPFLGGAFRSGIGAANGSHILLMFADLESDPHAFPALVAAAEANPDSVISASRWLPKGGFVRYGRIKLALNYFFQRLCALASNSHLTDFTYGYRLYPSDILKNAEWQETDHAFVLETILKPLVCSLFWMLTLLAYIRYVASRTWQNYLLVFIGSLCALMGKPMAVTLPFSLLLLDFWPLKRGQPEGQPGGSLWKRWRHLIFEKIPLFALSVIGSFLVYLAQKQAGALRQDIGLPFRIENALAAYWVYVRRIFWPDDLIPIYERHPWPIAIVIWGGIFLVCVSFLCFRLKQRHPYLLMGWLWYLGNLVPSIGIIQISAHAMANRYTYIPLIGVFIMVVWGVADVLLASRLSRRHVRFTAAAGAAVSFAIVACCTLRQLASWKDGVTLFTRAVSVAPWSSKAHYLLGMNFLKQNSYDEALIQGKESLRLDSTRTEAFVLIATVLRKTGRFAQAKSFYERALATKADDRQTLAGLAYLLSTVENADIRDGTAAVRHAERLCGLTRTEHPNYLSILACAYAEAGKFDAAIRTAEKGLATAHSIGDIRWVYALEDQVRLFREQKPVRVAPASADVAVRNIRESLSVREVLP